MIYSKILKIKGKKLFLILNNKKLSIFNIFFEIKSE
jgi:hypothetical protein